MTIELELKGQCPFWNPFQSNLLDYQTECLFHLVGYYCNRLRIFQNHIEYFITALQLDSSIVISCAASAESAPLVKVNCLHHFVFGSILMIYFARKSSRIKTIFNQIFAAGSILIDLKHAKKTINIYHSILEFCFNIEYALKFYEFFIVWNVDTINFVIVWKPIPYLSWNWEWYLPKKIWVPNF